MSQIYKSLASGPTPPSLVTKLVADTIDTDYSSIVQPTATDVSATLNKIQINGENGIRTYHMEALTSGATNILQIGFERGFTSTNGAVTATALTIIVPTNQAFTTQILVSGLADNSDALGGYAIATFKNIAGVVTIVDILDFIFNSDASLVGSIFNITASGANVLITVTGVAGRTITWGVCTPGIMTS